jgi:Lauroyl/myristoyl acyltransferase
MRKKLYFIKEFVEFILIKLLFNLFNLLPLKISKKFGSKIFLYIGRLSKYHSIAVKNCRMVFPNLKSIEIENIVNKSWENLGKNIFELYKLKKLFNDHALINIDGIENIENVIKNNTPTIFFSIHHSNWEICVPYLDSLGIKTGAIYRHINNKFLDNLVFKKRNSALISKDSFYTPKGKKSAKDIIEGIKKNKSVFLLVDQKDSAGELVNFFGKPVKTQIGFLKIARKYKMPIIPMQNQRLKNGRFKITFHQPIFHEDSSNDK